MTSYCSPLISAVDRRTRPEMNSNLPRDVQTAWGLLEWYTSRFLMLWSWARCPAFHQPVKKEEYKKLFCLMEPLFSTEQCNLCALSWPPWQVSAFKMSIVRLAIVRLAISPDESTRYDTPRRLFSYTNRIWMIDAFFSLVTLLWSETLCFFNIVL